MALTDENVQELQVDILKIIKKRVRVEFMRLVLILGTK